MSNVARLQPDMPVPSLRVGTVGGPCWRLCDQKPKHFTLVLFHRGAHCTACQAQLQEIDARIEHFQRRGISVLAVSADSRTRAEQSAADWDIDRLPLCWGLTRDQARAWGLVAGSLPDDRADADHPDFFVEPALFLVRPDGTLFGSLIQSAPVVPLRVDDILVGLDHALARGAPAANGHHLPTVAAE